MKASDWKSEETVVLAWVGTSVVDPMLVGKEVKALRLPVYDGKLEETLEPVSVGASEVDSSSVGKEVE